MAFLACNGLAIYNIIFFMNAPLVTIGIPAYNAERFIALAIKSVLTQTYANFELIITDDGSTDRTVEIAHSFDDPRINVIADGRNHGISYRLNQQIDLANGNYFVRMDADDLMMPDRIENQIKYLEVHKDVSVISGQAIVIDNNNTIIGIRKDCYTPYRFTIDDWIDGKTLIHPTIIGRTDFFRKYRYRDKFKGVEDMDLWSRSSNDSILVVLPEYVLFYRDPLSFKLSTYNFRRRQAEKLYVDTASRGIISKIIAIRLIFISMLKSIIASSLAFFHMDSIMISKRNKQLYDDVTYEKLLKEITKSC